MNIDDVCGVIARFLPDVDLAIMTFLDSKTSKKWIVRRFNITGATLPVELKLAYTSGVMQKIAVCDHVIIPCLAIPSFVAFMKKLKPCIVNYTQYWVTECKSNMLVCGYRDYPRDIQIGRVQLYIFFKTAWYHTLELNIANFLQLHKKSVVQIALKNDPYHMTLPNRYSLNSEIGYDQFIRNGW